ncbi:MAG: trypsin-like peptidase domain-containing protein [Candidatus Tectomicrobia bacterium]|nr:trypsin-like peptidase domain-containing protein [Candidatus Tectomicrobia bacterium]
MKSSVPGKKTWRAAAAGALTGLLVGSCAEVAPPPPAPPPPGVAASSLQGLPPGFADLAVRLRPSVVHVRAWRSGSPPRKGVDEGGLSADLREFFDRLFGTPGESGAEERGGLPPGGSGTGFFINAKGEVLTNHHVVEGTESIQVRLYGGEWLDARLVGADPRTDLALLRVKDGRSFPGARLGDSDLVRVGDWVLAIGNPFGLEETVTAGILSAKGRSLGGGDFNDYLQTDAPIHAGNSGGPLFNLQGEVIGVNTAVVKEATGIGFAIPINLVRRLLPDLRGYGRARRGWIGVSVQDLDSDLFRHFGVPPAEGVLITHVQAGGPAAEAGLRPGDVILTLGGSSLGGSEDFGRLLERAAIGAPTDLQLIRGGKRTTVRVTVRELHEATPAPQRPPQPAPLFHPPLGVDLRPLTPAMAGRLGLEDPAGLIVATVDPESPADRAGVKRGDVIRSVGLQAVRTLEGVQEILRGQKGAEILVLIQRGDRRFFTLLNLAPVTARTGKPGL